MDGTDACAAGSDNEYNSDDRTSILVILHHASFRETLLPPVTWHMDSDDATTGDDLKKWVQWKIWRKLSVWIELTQMWLDLVSPPDSPGLDYKFVRKINYTEEIREVLHQTDDTPVVQVRRSNATGSSSTKRRRLF